MKKGRKDQCMLTETLTPQKLPVLQDIEELFQLVSVKNRCIQQLPIEHASLLFLTCEHLEVKSSLYGVHTSPSLYGC